MKLIKKTISKLMIIALILIVGVGCQNMNQKANNDKLAKKKVTATTSFVYDMVKQLAGDKVDLELIIPYGEDPHLYTAKPEDLKKIKDADLLLYHGLHFEGKMIDVLEKNGKAITSTFDKAKIGSMEEDGETIMDPHFWFDIELYKEATSNVAKEIIKLLPESKEEINKNLDKYLSELTNLDKEIKTELNKINAESRYLITPHDAFNYFSRSYDIEVLAPQGVSTDSEVSNKDMEKTADFIVQHKIKAIFVESTTNPERMEKLQAICKSKGYEVKAVSGEDKELFSDSLAAKGEANTYIGMYRHNVKLIVDNLK